MLGDLKQVKPIARQFFVDEIIIAERCPTPLVIELMEIGRELDVEVLVIPGFYDELTPDVPIEYLGTFPVVALHRRNGKLLGHLLKRLCDIVLSSCFAGYTGTDFVGYPAADKTRFAGAGVLCLSSHWEKRTRLSLL